MIKLHLTIAALALSILSGCSVAPKIPAATELVAPEAIQDNTGKYMSPYTSDGVLAEWVDKAVNVKLGAAILSTAATIGAQQLAGHVPFVGGLIGHYVGNKLGRKLALEMSGGEEFIRESSDMSFNSLSNLAVHTYVYFSTHEHYQEAVEATMEIYPDLKRTYTTYLVYARKGHSDTGKYMLDNQEATVTIAALSDTESTPDSSTLEAKVEPENGLLEQQSNIDSSMEQAEDSISQTGPTSTENKFISPESENLAVTDTAL